MQASQTIFSDVVILAIKNNNNSFESGSRGLAGIIDSIF
jgi:hypothetical protein